MSMGYIGDSTSSSEMDYDEYRREDETAVSQPPGLTAPEIIGAPPHGATMVPIKWVSQKVNEGKCKYTLRPGAKRIASWVPQRIHQEWEVQGQWPYVPPYEWDFADWENARGEPSPVALKMCGYCDNRAHLTTQCPVEAEYTKRYGKARGKTMARLRIVCDLCDIMGHGHSQCPHIKYGDHSVVDVMRNFTGVHGWDVANLLDKVWITVDKQVIYKKDWFR